MNKIIAFFTRFPSRIRRHVWVPLQRAVIPILLAWKVAYRFSHRHSAEPHGLPEKLIVTLTSYPARFNKLPLTLKCLLTQTVAADRVILWVAHEDKDALTPAILDLQGQGLELIFCENLKSYKKIIPALKMFKECFIVTADDDLYYWPTWLEELVSSHQGERKEVVCHRAHHIHMANNNLPLPYSQWGLEMEGSLPSSLIFPTSGGGVLYPPNCLHTDVLREDLFTRLSPQADDIWLYWMMRLNDYVARRVGRGRRYYSWPGTQQNALWHSNFTGNGNDKQISAMIGYYGFPG